MEFVDSPLHKKLRQKLINHLYEAGIEQPEILAAMTAVPRHFFLDTIAPEFAYRDTAIPLSASFGAGQTISQPSTVALQTKLLQLKPTDKVLEIGTGCGYQAAVLCAMGVQVFSIERQQTLHVFAQKILQQLGFRPQLVFGDGFEGLPQEAPFDKIIVTCGAATMPQKLLEQLTIGGRMVIPLGEIGQQQMFAIDRQSPTDFKATKYGKCAFVPMLQGKM